MTALANSNKIYNYIRNITKSRSIPSTVHFDSLTASSDSDKAGLFNQYFHSVFIYTSSSLSIDDLPDLSHAINSVEFTEMEVYDALSSLDTNKASSNLEYYDYVPMPYTDHSIICLPFH